MSSSIVIDSTIVVYSLTDKTTLGNASRWFLGNNDFSLIAPPLLLAETESTINLKRLNREITRKEREAARAGLAALNIEILHLPQTHETARNIADSLRLPRVYDATFAALAMLRGVDYYTADLAFYNAARRKYPFVKTL
jgi:predicted nucleic acid-binding protein